MIVTVKTLQQETYKVEVKPTDNVRSLKEKLQTQLGTGKYPVENQRLIYAGTVLDDNKAVSHYNIEESKFIVIMIAKEGAQRTNQQRQNDGSSAAQPHDTGLSSLNQQRLRATSPAESIQNSTTLSNVSVNSGPLESFHDDLVSAMLDSDLHAPLFDFDHFFPPAHEILQSVLADNNIELPVDVFDELVSESNNDAQPVIDSSLDELSQLKPHIDAAGGLDAYIEAANSSNNEPISRVVAAMALRDTATHMGLSSDNAASLLLSPGAASFSDDQLTEDFLSFNQSFFTPSVGNEKERNVQDMNQFLASDIDRLITNIMALGFERESVQLALSASHNDPDLAVEYLTADGSDHSFNPTESFDLRTYLRDNPQLQSMVDALSENPSTFPTFLQQLADDHPQLLQYINANQEDFMQLVSSPSNESAEETINSPISSLERSDIQQLQALGFSEFDSVQAYLACDRDVEMAAELLLSDNTQ